MNRRNVVSKEIATVYKAGSRRFFTKRAAYNHAAREKIKSRWGNESFKYSESGLISDEITVRYDYDPERLATVQARLARWYKHIDK